MKEIVMLDARGEQKIEQRELQHKLLDICEQYTPAMASGAIGQTHAAIFILREVEKDEFLKHCAEIYDAMEISYRKFLCAITNEEDEK